MGKGGGSSGPQQTTAYQTNLPEYAKPYVENMLNAAQAQIYNPDMTTFREYRPYSTDPTQYFAGPSSLQKSTYGEAEAMQTPGGYAPAQALTGLAAMGQMSAGRQFQRQATDPYATQAYMSPYMQNVVDVQKANAIRDYQKGIPALRQQASAAGAFGGSRQAIQESEAQRSLLANLANIQAQGTQNAFQNAQAQQQFGANLGLQGLSGATQSATALGQLAGAQQQSDIARMGLQNQLGAQQQQYQQGIINQAIQDYATQQQYPYMQLSTMSNLLRGLPMQNMTTQGYQAAPSMTSQLAGLGGTALGLYGMSGGFKAAQGGQVPSYAGGGEIKGYAGPQGSLVTDMPTSGVAGNIVRDLMSKNVQELVEIARTNPSKEIRDMAGRLAARKEIEEKQAQSMGITSAAVPNFDDMGVATGASGGIVAFAGEDGSYVDEEELRKRYNVQPDSALMGIANNLGYLKAKGFGEQTPEAKAISENIAEAKKAYGPDFEDKNFWRAFTKGSAKAGAGTSQYGIQNILGGIDTGVEEYAKGENRKEDMLNKLRQGEIDLSKLTTSERNNLLHYATSAASTEEAAKLRLEGVKHNAALRGIEAGKRDDARAEAARNREETQIREWTKIFIGTGNTNPSAEQIAAARKKAEEYVASTKVIKIPS